MLTCLLAINFFYYAIRIYYEIYLEIFLPYYELGVGVDSSLLTLSLVYRIVQAFVYLTIVIYCIKNRTKSTNNITLLFYYLIDEAELIDKSKYLPKQILYLRFGIFLLVLGIIPLMDTGFNYISHWDICILTINFNCSTIKLICNIFTIIVVFLLVLIHYIEYALHIVVTEKNCKDKRDPHYLLAGPSSSFTQTLLRYLQLTATAAGVAGGIDLAVRQYKNMTDPEWSRYQVQLVLQLEELEKKRKELEAISKALQESKEKLSLYEVKYISIFSNQNEVFKTFDLDNSAILKKIAERKEKMKKIELGTLTEKEKESYYTELSFLNKDIERRIEQNQYRINKIIKENETAQSEITAEVSNETKEAGVGMGVYYTMKDLYKDLTLEQTFSVVFLVLSNVMMSSLISIVLILFGDHLIKKFKLEEKYPRLAKWIQLRRRLQRYYILLNIGWLLVAAFMAMGSTLLLIFIALKYRYLI